MNSIMRNCLKLFAAFAIVTLTESIALAGGGDALSGFPKIDQVARKQEARAAVFSPLSSAVVVTGYQNLAGDVNDSAYTVKYDASGTPVWRATYDPSSGIERGVALAMDKNRDSIMVASVVVSGKPSVYVTRYHDNGTQAPTVVWSNTWSSGVTGGADHPLAIAYDPVLDRVYVAGFTRSGNGDDDYLLLAFDNNVSGDNPPLWSDSYGASGADRAYAVAVSADGTRIALTGESSNGTDLDLVTVLWDAAGSQQRNWRKGGTGSLDDSGLALAFTPSGNIAVTGMLANIRGGDIYTAELAPGSSTPVWEATHDAGFDDQPSALVVDQAGDVYVSGYAGPLPAFSKLFLVKYHNNGTSLPDTVWSATFDPGSTNISGAVALTVDSSANPTGGVYVAGWRDYSGVKKIVVLKYGRNNGRLLWQKEWDGLSGKSSVPVGVGMQGGAVVVPAWTDQTQPLDGGILTATGGSTVTLENSGKAWGSNVWAGYYLYLVSGQNTENNGLFRPIKSNGLTLLTLDSAQAFPKTVAVGDQYYIFDQDNIDFALLRLDRGTMDPPTALAAQADSNTSVKLSFEDNTESETGFKVYWKIGENGNWCNDAAAWDIPSSTPSQTGTVNWTATGLTSDTDYYFKVASYQGVTVGDFSNVANAITRGVITFSPTSGSYSYTDPQGGDDTLISAACYSGGNPVFFGSIYADLNTSGQPSYDFYTFKTTRDFSTVSWSDKLDGGYDEHDTAVAMVVDANRETVIVGTSSQGVSGVGNIPSIWGHKYAYSPAVDGYGQAVPLWTNQLNGSGNLADHADAVAVQPVSPYSVAIVGHGNADLTQINYYVRKLSPTTDPAAPHTDFTVESSSAYQFSDNTPFTGTPNPTATVMNAAGDVFVAGWLQGSGGNNNWFVSKHDGTTGNKVWLETLGGSGDDKPFAMALDSSGDLYVAGYTTDAATGFTVMTVAKFQGSAAAGSSSLLWTRKYPSGTPTGNSAARKISYDSYANQIVVGGEVFVTAGDSDLALLRFDTAGDPLWDRTLRRSGTSETLTGLSIDPSGYIYMSGDSGTGANADIVAAIYTESGSYAEAFAYNGTAGKEDHAASLATNQFGEGFIAGYTTSAAGDKDMLALRIVNNLVIMPTGLSATPQSDYTKVTLGWTNVTAGTTPYLSRSVKDSGIWVSPAGLTNGQLSADAVTFTDTGLLPNTTYCWRLYAEKGTVTTRHTAEVCAPTVYAPPAAPVPTNPTSSVNSLRITWTNVAGNTGYQLERKTGTSGTYAVIASPAANETSYDDTGLSTSTAYYYRLSVRNVSGLSQPSTNSAPGYTAPNPVTTWYYAAGTSSSSINIQWYAPSGSSVTDYRIERRLAGGSWATVTTTGSSSYTDSTGLVANTAYEYRIYSRYNGVETVTPSPGRTVNTLLDPPTLQNATVISDTSYSATWTQVAGNTGYTAVAKSCPGSVATMLANPAGNCTAIEESTAVGTNIVTTTGSTSSNIAYRGWYIVVRTQSAGGASVNSNGILLFKPMSVTLSNVEIPGSGQLKPVWTNTTEENFDVQRRPAGGTWTTVKSAIAADTLNWIDATVTDGTEYCYRIRAYTSAGGPADAYSNEICKTAQAPPSPPQLTMTAPTSTSVKLEWVNTNYSATDFDVYLSSYNYGSGGKPESYSAWGASSKVGSVTGCASGALCSYTYNTSRGAGLTGFVRMNYNGTMIDSQVASPTAGYIQTVPSPPTISSTSATSASITINWYRVDPAYSYKLYYKRSSDTDWSTPLAIAYAWNPNPYPYTLSGLSSGTPYQVKVESVGKYQESGDAVVANISTVPLAPAKPVISNVGQNQLTVTWESVASATSYKLERSTDNSTWTVATNQNVLTYNDSGLAAGTKYWYRVKGVNSGGDSVPSEPETVTTIPAAPGVPLLITRSDSRITVGIRTMKGATGYKVYRKDGGTGGTQNLTATVSVPYAESYCGSAYPTINCAASSAQIYDSDDTGLSANTSYCYAVAAINAAGDSAIGPEYCTLTSPYAPAALVGESISPYKALFTITPGTGAAPTGYQLEYKQGDNWSLITRIPYGTNTYTLSGLLGPGGTGQFRVRAYKQLADDFTSGINPAIWSQQVVIRDPSNVVTVNATTPPLSYSTSNGNSSIVAANGVATLSQSSTGNGTTNSWNSAAIKLADVSPLLGDFDFSTKMRLPAGEITGNQYHVYARLQFNMPATSGRSNFFYVGRYASTANGYEICWTLDGVSTCNGTGANNTEGGLRITRTGRTVSGWMANSKGNAWQPFMSHTEFQAASGTSGQISQSLARSEAMSLVTDLDDTQLIGAITSPSNEVTVTMQNYNGVQNSCP
ncbi:titin [Geobacter sp. OR-1]|uniref:fibronectin type III domain-containing protein n=1 Tax=Geobacter sp. OR-1 TaxID=1266765 RepID=UPI000541ADCF|nr:fibronectin type III domain-containing protein [Geobacter sp. OR-1]GAM07994.1 titin [Geobacter sp. OR-1]